MIENLNTQTFGRLTVIGLAGMNKWHNALWLCRCECRTLITRPAQYLKSGRTRSCGCLSQESRREVNTKHGRAGTPEYIAYVGAKTRCENPKATKYERWGGRGIEFRFASFEEFFAELGYRPSPKHSLDRIDNNGHYEAGNVRWATAVEQGFNRRDTRLITINGVTRTMSDWELSPNARCKPIIARRLNKGFCGSCAVFGAKNSKCPH